MPRAAASPVVHIDDDRFKVTEWRFEAAAESGWHVHGHDYVIVPVTDGALLQAKAGGTSREAPLQHHVPCARRTGVERSFMNGGEIPLAFFEVEGLPEGRVA